MSNLNQGSHISNMKKIPLSIFKIWASKLSKRFKGPPGGSRGLHYSFCTLYKIMKQRNPDSITLKFGTDNVKMNSHVNSVLYKFNECSWCCLRFFAWKNWSVLCLQGKPLTGMAGIFWCRDWLIIAIYANMMSFIIIIIILIQEN